MTQYCLNDIKNCKLALEAAALQSWPPYVTYREDEILRKKWKWIHYDGKRVIMWDMTNIPAYAFENSDTQRATYSDYYGDWCVKGGLECSCVGRLSM